jgi:hypothetical protein
MPLTKIQSLGITDGTIVNADINASAAIAGTKLTGVNDAKAWINFNGTGTPAIRASFNVSSITDNNTGDYSVNFTTALTDINYALAGATVIDNDNSTGSPNGDLAISRATSAMTTSSCRINSFGPTGSIQDHKFITAIFVR